MRIKRDGVWRQIWASNQDTERWANRDGSAWPCSTIRGHRVFAEFDTNDDLIDLRIDGGDSNPETGLYNHNLFIDGNELMAFLSDVSEKRFQ